MAVHTPAHSASKPRSTSHRRPGPCKRPSFSRATLLDVALATAAAVYSLLIPLALLPTWRSANPEYSDNAPTGAHLVAMTVAELVAGLSVMVRRKFPLLLAGTSVTALWLSGPGLTFPVALYTLLVRGRRRWAVATATAGAAVPALYLHLVFDTAGGGDRPPPVPLLLWIESAIMRYWLPMIVLPVLAAMAIHNLRRRTEQLHREQALAACNARLEERTRIARDIHDVVAHYVGLMVLQAGALEVRSTAQPEINNLAQGLGDLGRKAMGELRDLMGVLRPDRIDEDSDHTDDGSDGVRWRREVHTLVNNARLAGVPVSWYIEGDPEQSGATARQIAYRVIQEGIANAVRHASGAEVRVAVRVSGEAVDIDVRNGPSPLSGTMRGTTVGSGHGLTGMRERVTLVGGTLRAEPTPGGGFRLSARVPAQAETTEVPVMDIAGIHAETFQHEKRTAHDHSSGRRRRGTGKAKHPAGAGHR